MNTGNENSVWTAWRGALLVTAAALVLSLSLGTSLAEAKKKLVNINRASQAELEAIKGVGPATAGKIIANRPYKSLEELSKAGLSAKKIKSLESFLTVGSASEAAGKEKKKRAVEEKATHKVKTAPSAAKEKKHAGKLVPGQKVNINKASKEELEKIPEIGPAKAQRIIDGRPYHKIEDVMKVKGIKQHTFERIKDYIKVR